jgi:hypothetical protein
MDRVCEFRSSRGYTPVSAPFCAALSYTGLLEMVAILFAVFLCMGLKDPVGLNKSTGKILFYGNYTSKNIAGFTIMR